MASEAVLVSLSCSYGLGGRFFKYEFYTFKNAIYDSQIDYKPLGIHIFDLE